MYAENQKILKIEIIKLNYWIRTEGKQNTSGEPKEWECRAIKVSPTLDTGSHKANPHTNEGPC